MGRPSSWAIGPRPLGSQGVSFLSFSFLLFIYFSDFVFFQFPFLFILVSDIFSFFKVLSQHLNQYHQNRPLPNLVWTQNKLVQYIFIFQKLLNQLFLLLFIHFSAFKYFIKMWFLHPNHLCISWITPNILVLIFEFFYCFIDFEFEFESVSN